VVLHTVAVGVANWVSVTQFDAERVSIPSSSIGRYQGIDKSTRYCLPLEVSSINLAMFIPLPPITCILTISVSTICSCILQ